MACCGGGGEGVVGVIDVGAGEGAGGGQSRVGFREGDGGGGDGGGIVGAGDGDGEIERCWRLSVVEVTLKGFRGEESSSIQGPIARVVDGGGRRRAGAPVGLDGRCGLPNSACCGRINGVCVGEIEVVEAEGTGFVDVGGPGRVGGFCDGEVVDGGVNDRRIVGAGDGDGEIVLVIGAICPSSTVMS